MGKKPTPIAVYIFCFQLFRDNYEKSLSSPPIISSRAVITKVEVWVSNANNTTENLKNIIGFMDLGEGTQANIYNDALVIDNNTAANADFSSNAANNLYFNIADSTSSYNTTQIRGFVGSNQALEAQGFNNGIDFEKYEQDAIACADWIMKTPLNEQKAKRAKAYKFLISYVSGSPKISATLNVEASPYIDNQDLLVVFLASWTKSCLQQNYANNIEEFTLRATDDVLKFYSKNKKSVGKAKKIKKFLKMQKKGTLHAYVKSKL